ncbi:exoprotein [Erythrobacter sp. KY5]|uniref:intermembrane phospholipid transport protein YdbH family protein n=1 Tax=Erythrobacter sp. KY5 TaxID=2011159 RepID=UPI000DBF0C57|nr:YdbH domain-containing protein [Erythrobacter sp. KY5]AWW75043.1 exoprotein [Erythrobacter sp. KY5]
MSDAPSPFDSTMERRSLLRGMWPDRWRWRFSLLTVIFVIVFGSAAWIERDRIAANLIDDALEANGIEATYEISEIGPQRQVIKDVVVGDPLSPDLVIEQVNVDVVLTLGTPQIGRVELVRPRLYGAIRDGRLSLGALDPVLYAESDGPPGLPAFDIAIVDGRARIESDFGVIGAKLDGAGRLDGGFEGIIAATAPGIGTENCSVDSLTVYGDVLVDSGRPIFDGPVRLRGLDCEGASMASADIAARVEFSDTFDSFDSNLGIAAADIGYGGDAASALDGKVDLLWRFGGDRQGAMGDFSARHDLVASGVTSAYANIGQLGAEGQLRFTNSMSRGEWSARFTGERAELALDARSAFADLREASEGTFIASLLAKAERGLTNGLRDARLAGDVTVRTNPQGLRVIVPEARLRSADGQTLLALSRVSYSQSDEAGNLLTGNFFTGGADLPQINGRMDRRANGDIAVRMATAEFGSGDDALAVPRLTLLQSAGGAISFNGLVQAEGALPGGKVDGLLVPLEGTYSASAGLAIGRRCTAVAVRGLELYQLSLDERRVTVCPQAGASAMVRYRDALDISIATQALDLSGAIGDSRARLSASSAVLRYPGPFELRGFEAVIGDPDNAVRFAAEQLEGRLGESMGGTFSGASAAMDVVPLDLSQLSGNWSYQDGALLVEDGAFRVSDRVDPANGADPRFEPLMARGASLVLEDNTILADAALRHPESDTLITNVSIRHDLSQGTGRADIDVPGIRFGDALQPDDLSILARGVVAAAQGTIRGDGVITWTPDGIDSSGMFRTDDFDFAAAFGPVQQVSGEIEFTDLLGLTTAPGQVLNIGTVNPGIEALGGQVAYSLTGGTLVTVEEGRWPFMGGTLILRPTKINFGGGEGQSYVFELIALDAATFVTQMELSNIGATGTFDGTIPMFFDADGNGSINGGLLISRPPGGNVSYVGELTYEDLGAIANYAFNSLRSLDYNQMAVELNGDLAGEIVTNFKIDGVRQGEGASRNFITRQLADLPIRFNVNVRSENFYLLATIVRGIFDPTIFDTPAMRESLGIGEFAPIETEPQPSPGPELPAPVEEIIPRRDESTEALLRDESTVQPPESDNLP